MNSFKLPENMPKGTRRIFPAISRWLFRLSGWTIQNKLPNVKKGIIIAAPHTSNWDIFPASLVIYGLNIQPTVMAKDKLFKWPVVGWFMHTIGAIPIQQSGKKNYVELFKDKLAQADKMLLVLSPEGTRKKTEQWRSSFLHIAYATGLPLIAAGLDYGKKEVWLEQPFNLTGNKDNDMLQVRRYFQKFKGKSPNNQSSIV